MPQRHLFLSYCRDNYNAVARLRNDLIAIGEHVWWDQDILPGENWRFAIRHAMKSAYAIIACFSEETDTRKRSGMYPELRDAIDAYRNYAPGHLFLIPVRFSPATVPDFDIDSITTLSSLQYVDLFPEKQRNAGLKKLKLAIQSATGHPP